jgi:hypothetical protein
MKTPILAGNADSADSAKATHPHEISYLYLAIQDLIPEITNTVFIPVIPALLVFFRAKNN